uniref:Uncharacterized protein n=1 Tax=Amphimedon queenslandica TaxID=400682 RepID=A0A1X7TJI0_AMPQE
HPPGCIGFGIASPEGKKNDAPRGYLGGHRVDRRAGFFHRRYASGSSRSNGYYRIHRVAVHISRTGIDRKRSVNRVN